MHTRQDVGLPDRSLIEEVHICGDGGPPTFLNWCSCCSPQVGWHLVILSGRLLLALTLTLALGANALHGSGLLLPGGVSQRMLHQLVLQKALRCALQAQTVLLAPPAQQVDRLPARPAGSSAQLEVMTCSVGELQEHLQAPVQAQAILLLPPAQQQAVSSCLWWPASAGRPALACTAASCQLMYVVVC